MKRERGSVVAYNYYDELIEKPYRGKKDKFLIHNPTEHYPSNHEAKIVRRLCAKNKMTEDEIRSVKKFRKMIADEVKNQNKRDIWSQNLNKARYGARRIIDRAAEEVGKYRLHPDTLQRAKEISMEYDSHSCNRISAVTDYIINLLKSSKGK